jgi:ubiquinol-cytochrome c reductase cytochrome c subunit
MAATSFVRIDGYALPNFSGTFHAVKTVLVAFLAVVLLAATHGNEGAVLYGTHCASCHGSSGQGSSVAPPLIGKSATDVHFMLDTGRMPAPAPSVNEIQRIPTFTEAQIDAIVAYVLGFSPHADAALPLVSGGDVNRGRNLFAANCAPCHGAVGDGASIGASDVAPSLATATVFQVAEAIRVGPGVMPRFGTDVLSDRDVDDITRFVNLVQTQPPGRYSIDAGGIALAHTGPVAEGFIAWFFGLGALVLFVRGIGTAGPRS